MNRRNGTGWSAGLLAVGLLSASTFAAPEDAGQLLENGYAGGEYGRVAYSEFGLEVERADDGGRSDDADVNAPLFPGDLTRTEPGQRAVLELGNAIQIFQDAATELTFLSLPNPYADFSDNTILQLSSGAIRLEAPVQEGDELRVDTPAASVYLLSDADVRVEIYDSGRTVVHSWRGVVEVVGNEGSVLVRAGMSTDVYPGSLPAEATPFNTFARDGFDRWVDGRRDAVRVVDRYDDDGRYDDVYEELPYEVRPYQRELNRHGSWRQVADYGYVWYPTAVSVGWRPYSDGYWHWGRSGYFWVSSEPWGWAPYRYGRWIFNDGWCWVPGRVFGGGWVAWSYGNAYVGWSPLGFYDRPWRVSLNFGVGYRHGWSFLHYDNFYRRGYGRHYVTPHHVYRYGHAHHVTRRAVRIGPRDLSANVNARRQAVQVAANGPRYDVRAPQRGVNSRTSFRNREAQGWNNAVNRARSANASDRAVSSTAGRGGTRGGGRAIVQDRGGNGRSPSATASRGGTRSGRGPTPDARGVNRAGRDGSGRAVQGYPRRITADPRTSAGSGRSSAGRGSRGNDRAVVRDRGRTDRTPTARTPASGRNGDSTVDRRRSSGDRRSIYQRMAQPRSGSSGERNSTSRSGRGVGRRPESSASGRSSSGRQQTTTRSGRSGSPQRPTTRSGSSSRTRQQSSTRSGSTSRGRQQPSTRSGSSSRGRQQPSTRSGASSRGRQQPSGPVGKLLPRSTTVVQPLGELFPRPLFGASRALLVRRSALHRSLRRLISWALFRPLLFRPLLLRPLQFGSLGFPRSRQRPTLTGFDRSSIPGGVHPLSCFRRRAGGLAAGSFYYGARCLGALGLGARRQRLDVEAERPAGEWRESTLTADPL